MNQINDVQADGMNDSKKANEVPQSAKSPNTTESFSGRIIFAKDGGEAKINFCKNLSKDEEKVVSKVPIQLVTILHNVYPNTGDGQTVSTQKFKVIDASTKADEGKEESASTRTHPKNEAINSQRFLLCFPCLLRFQEAEEFLTHGRECHIINVDDQIITASTKNTSTIIQESENGKASICFLEPTVEDDNPDFTQPHPQGFTQQNQAPSPVGLTTRNTNFCDAINGGSIKSKDMEMNEIREDIMRADSDSEMKPVSADKAPSNQEDRDPVTDSPLHSETSIGQTGEGSIPNIQQTSTERASKASPVTSQASTNNSSLQYNNAKGSTKIKDSLFGGVGGVTNLDPLFHMSLFQSRNSCKTLKCPKCNWHYKYRQTLDAHMKEKHADETSDCIYCNTNQPHPRLSRGESYACGYKPFKCEVCNYSTTTKGNLSIHMQSDKHLYNVKSMQHQRQQQDKEKASGNTQSNNEPNSTSRLTSDQLQNLRQQQQGTKHLQTHSTKGVKDITGGKASNNNRRQLWRCDVCNYETDIPRNLRIHMQSEKHSHNIALAGVRERMGSHKSMKTEENAEDDHVKSSVSKTSMMKEPPSNLPHPNTEQANPTLNALYYYLAAMQNPMHSQGNDIQGNSNEREKQFMAQQQQLLLAQQYQQMLAQYAGSNDTASPAALIQQQLMLQQQMQLFRNLLTQADRPPNLLTKLSDADIALHDINNPLSASDQFLFTCGICCNFSCNDLESFCTHVRAPRYSRNSLDESEWITKSPTDGYLCRICNYTTQLKTNFSLHCKTEKHTSKLQLINHIREGGESNEWKVSYAIAGNNMNKVTCNGCKHSATSIDKLRIHCSTDRHQGTLTMCHYFDSMLKEAELNKSSTSPEETISRRLSCRPCSYKSKFVVGMIQHMQSQSHQSKLREEQQEGSHISEDSVTVELVVEDSNAGRNSASANAVNSSDETISKASSGRTEDVKVFRCKLCVFVTDDDLKLQEHNASQHFSQSAIKCPMCPEYLNDTTLFQTHLIEVHRLTEQFQSPQPNLQHMSSTSIPIKIEGTLQAIHFSCREQSESSRNQEESPSSQKESRQDDQLTQLSRDTDINDMNNQDSIKAMDEKDTRAIEDESLHEDAGHTNRAIFENPSELLHIICRDKTLAASVMADPQFTETWSCLDPPFTCSHCEETYLSKRDLLNHLRTSKEHCGNVNAPLHKQTSCVSSPPSDGVLQTTTCSRDSTHRRTRSDPCEPENSEDLNRQGTDGSESQGISKSTHKAVLQEVGFDEVSHFVENKSDENRENAKQWKRDVTDLSNDSTEHSLCRSSNLKRHFELTCGQCGKEFSNSWILKVHEKSVHNLEMSPEMLNEFIQGYTSWYWECLKKDAESANSLTNSRESSSVIEDDTCVPPPVNETSPKQELLVPDSASNSINDDDTRDFQNVAMQAFIKNYSGLMPQAHGMLPSSPGQRQNAAGIGDEQTRLQQQQMLLQCLMNAQAQAALQQQSILGGSNKPINQTNSPNIMNMFMDQMYSAAMQGSNTPGFMDPMAVMALLQQQQQQQSRIPGNNTVNQWLAMRFIQQQQQMQQMLMYPPGLGCGNSSLPFPPSLGDNNVQQQMISAFAASMLGSSISPDSLPAALMNNNNPVVANMLHAYQVQAAAAAAAASSLPTSSKGSDADSAKLLRAQQPTNHSSSNSQLSQSQTDIPAKRPRTRITDDQLKVLRSNFDINTSPGEEQVAEMALKTNLPPKVIKHWFRNTLFKERQRSKDSPYNFNIPPITSLDDSNIDTQPTPTDSPKGGAPSSPDDHKDANDLRNRKNSEIENICDMPGAEEQPEVGDLSHEMPIANGTRNDALKFLQSFGCSSGKIAEAQQQFYSNPLAYMAASLGQAATTESPLQLSSDVPAKNNAEEDFIETSNYSFGRSVSHGSTEYPYSATTSHSNMTSITRRTPRTRFSDYQLKVLQEFFDKNAYPKDEDLDRLSRVLELSTRVIVVWFQNARQKARKSYELQHGSMAQQSSNNSNFNNFTRKRNSSPQSPNIPNKPTMSLDLHVASKHFNMSRDSSGRTSESMDRTTPVKCGKCDIGFATIRALQEHEKLHASSNSSVSNQQHNKSDLSLSLMNDSSRGSPTPSDKSLEPSERSPSEYKIAMSQTQSFNEIISRFGISEMMKYGGKPSPEYKSTTSLTSSQTSSPFMSQGDFLSRQGLSPLHNHLSPGSLANSVGNRSIPGLKRKGMSESNKDPKRLRTTITPEQLEFLYQQYLVDSSPSRKVIEQISDIVGLKKRVVQVWFQNTRARERKGQFRSVGRINAVLGMPQTCPHCRVTFRTKADLDAHVRYRHMQSPSAVAMSMGQSRQVSPGAAFPTAASSSRDDSHPSILQEKDIDYKELFNKNTREEDLVSQSKALSDHTDPYETINGDPDEKRRKISNDSDQLKSLTSGTASIISARTAEIYKAVSEQIFGNKSAINNLSHLGETSMSAMNSTSNPASVSNSVSDYHAVSPQAVSSPDSTGSSNPSFMVPSKRYRTQMTSLQVNALKHCFTEYKTPTLLECEILGEQIGLPKRVIQVWFQNARAKDKKIIRQGETPSEEPHSPAKSSCQLCPEVRFGSEQDYRNHIFSKFHLQNFISSVGGESQVPSKPSSEYESEDIPQKDSPIRSTSRSPSPPNTEAKYRVSAIATANGLPVPFTENQSPISSSWSPTTLAKRYQQQFSVMHGLAAKAVEGRNDDDNAQEQNQQQDAAVLQQFRQAWLQQASLLANSFRGDSASRPFEGVKSSQTTTQAD